MTKQKINKCSLYKNFLLQLVWKNPLLAITCGSHKSSVFLLISEWISISTIYWTKYDRRYSDNLRFSRKKKHFDSDCDFYCKLKSQNHNSVDMTRLGNYEQQFIWRLCENLNCSVSNYFYFFLLKPKDPQWKPKIWSVDKTTNLFSSHAEIRTECQFPFATL